MIAPPVWSEEELNAERLKSIEVFRKERIDEPLEDYLEAFDEYQGYIEDLLETTVDLSQLDCAALDVLSDPRLLEAFRYLAGPPISKDDLQILADAPSLAKGRLKQRPEDVRRLVDVIRQVLDRRRFSWVVEGRDATEAERGAAVMASAALLAASRTQTRRRHVTKEQQELATKQALIQLGFLEVATRKIVNTSLAPSPGEFCGESLLGTRKADLVARLWDQRLMPIECKVSNSSTNSIKRLNNDAAVKAEIWKKDFGIRQVVPTAVLGGVYKLGNLVEAQERGLAIFWAHDLEALTNWIERTRIA